ncbi:MAG: hydrolase [Deltaproteobacteria bacterium]|jgi:predicted hydrolase (HD superfamily)|nr:hydrolase [Deltaproteobacteria bacterium]
MRSTITPAQAWEILKLYNTEPFHLQHAWTVSQVMRWFAGDQDLAAESDYWAVVGLLHDIDFEKYPQEHCLKAPDLLRNHGLGEDVIRAVVSHAYGITVQVRPEHQMEKILYAADELTGLIWAAALMRPSKSVQDLETKSVRKKFKTVSFAAGCSREVISRGAEMLGWELEDLIGKTILAMRFWEENQAPGF